MSGATSIEEIAKEIVELPRHQRLVLLRANQNGNG